MRGEAVATLVCAVFVLAAPPARSGAGVERAVVARGQTTFVRYCVSCHGPAAKGDGPLANDLRVPVPDLTTMAARAGGGFPYDRVVEIVRGGEIVRGHGTADMPAWGDVFKKTTGTGETTARAAVRNLAEYLRSVQQPAKPPATPPAK